MQQTPKYFLNKVNIDSITMLITTARWWIRQGSLCQTLSILCSKLTTEDKCLQDPQ